MLIRTYFKLSFMFTHFYIILISQVFKKQQKLNKMIHTKASLAQAKKDGTQHDFKVVTNDTNKLRKTKVFKMVSKLIFSLFWLLNSYNNFRNLHLNQQQMMTVMMILMKYLVTEEVNEKNKLNQIKQFLTTKLLEMK